MATKKSTAAAVADEVMETNKEFETSGNGKAHKSEVKFEGMLAREEAISYFEAIVRGMKKGSIHLQQGDGDLTLSPQPNVEMEVRASQKKNRERLSFELSWKTPGESDLTITAD